MERSRTFAEVVEGEDLDVLTVLKPAPQFRFLSSRHLAAAAHDENAVRILDSRKMPPGVRDVPGDPPLGIKHLPHRLTE